MSEARLGSAEAPKPNYLTPKLLAIVLAMDAAFVFFAAIVAFGLKTLPPVAAFVGGGILMVIFILLAALVRRAMWVLWAGTVGQLVLIALGFWVMPMFFIGVASAVLWVWCLRRGQRVDRATRAALAANDDQEQNR